jgi:putative heme-binding domain-containing protein
MGDTARGRLFRVTARSEGVSPSLSPLRARRPQYETATQAIELLKSPNEATRFIGWERIIKLGKQAVPDLKAWFGDKNADSQYRARALWLLASLSQENAINAALTDTDPNIRITAIRVARQLWQQKLPEKLREVIAKVVNDESPAVRREAAIALRFDASSQASKLLRATALQYDRWSLEAIGIGANLFRSERWLADLGGLADEAYFVVQRAKLVWLCGDLNQTTKTMSLWYPSNSSVYATEFRNSTAFSGEPREVTLKPAMLLRSLQLLSYHHKAEVSKAALDIFLKADAETALASTALLDRNTIASNPEAKARLDSLLKPVIGKPEFIDLVQRLNLTGFEQELLDYITAHPDAAESITAARLLAANVGRTVAFLTQADAAAARKLVSALGKVSDRPSVAVLNQAFWPEKREDVRRSMIEAMALSSEGGRAILKWNAEKKLPDTLKTAAALALSRSTDGGLRDQASKELPLPAAIGAEKFPPLADLLKLKGDATKGQAMFMQAGCVACHQVKGQFINFGPDLTQIGNKLSPDGLFTAILYPSAAVEHSYGGVTISAKNSVTATGYIISETDSDITLRINGGAAQTIAKSTITSRQEMKESLMPPGLVAAIGPQGLADLVAWLQTLK